MPVVLPTSARTVDLPQRPVPPGHARPNHGGRARFARWPLAALGVATALLHVLANAVSPYGVHRDELLYLAMGRHLQLWRMDFPPLIAALAEFTRAFHLSPGPERITLVRLPSAIAAGVLVVLAGRIAHALGGRRPAQLLAALAVIASPLFMRTGTLYQPVVFDQLWWTLALYAVVRLGRLAPARAPRGDWALLALALGLGLLTKFSILFLGVGLVVAFLLTPLRATLRDGAPWLTLAVALAVGAPSIAGQLQLGWPVIGQMHALRGAQLARVGPLDFLGGQLLLGPAVLLAGLGAWDTIRRKDAPGRAAAIAAVAAFVLLLVLHGKAYYVGPIYPLLWAAGAVALERRFADHPAVEGAGQPAPDRRRRRRLALAGGAALLGAYGLLTLPLGVPLLAPPAMAHYGAALGVGTTTNTGMRLALPQDFADMLGWPAQAAAVAQEYARLTPDERGTAVVAAANYGEAGALDFYGPSLGLPPAVSSEGSYWFFGPGDLPGDVTLVLGPPAAARDLARLFADVRPARRVVHPDLRWVVPEERDVWVFVCRRPRRPLQDVWPALAGQS